MKNWSAGPVLLCGAAIVVAGCSDPAGLGESRVPSSTALTVSNSPRDLGTLGGANSSAADINDAGVVVGASEVAGGTHAFRWTRDHGLVDLGELGGGFSEALQINANGYVLGYSRDRDWKLHIVLWTPTNRLVDLGRPPGDEDFRVAGFNNANTVVGDLYGNEELLPHIWQWRKETGYVNVDPFRYNWETYAVGIDNRGTIAGNICCNRTAIYGWYRYTSSGEFHSLGTATDFNGSAAAQNDRHQVIGFDEMGLGTWPYPDYWIGGFVWTPGVGFTYLGSLGGWTTYPRAINDLGEIVGSSSTIPMNDEDPLIGFYYSAKLGMVRLPGRDNGLTGVGGINRDGQIAGAIQLPSGNWHAALWSRPATGTTALRAQRPRLAVASGRFGQCLTDRGAQRTRTGVGQCLAEVGPDRSRSAQAH